MTVTQKKPRTCAIRLVGFVHWSPNIIHTVESGFFECLINQTSQSKFLLTFLGNKVFSKKWWSSVFYIRIKL